jgi:hypothetical protein
LSFSFEIFMHYFQLALMALVYKGSGLPGNKLCISQQQLQFLRVICSKKLCIKDRRRRAPVYVIAFGARVKTLARYPRCRHVSGRSLIP